MTQEPNDGFFTRVLRDRRVSSLDYYVSLTDMANRLRDYRKKELSCVDEYGRHSALYKRFSDEIESLEKKAEKAYHNFLLWNAEENTIEIKLRPLTFTPHTSEKSNRGSKIVKDGKAKFGSQMSRIMAYWQKSGNQYLTNEAARELKLTTYLSARVKDFRYMGIEIESDLIKDGFVHFRLKCTCDNECYLHSENLKIEICPKS